MSTVAQLQDLDIWTSLPTNDGLIQALVRMRPNEYYGTGHTLVMRYRNTRIEIDLSGEWMVSTYAIPNTLPSLSN